MKRISLRKGKENKNELWVTIFSKFLLSYFFSKTFRKKKNEWIAKDKIIFMSWKRDITISGSFLLLSFTLKGEVSKWIITFTSLAFSELLLRNQEEKLVVLDINLATLTELILLSFNSTLLFLLILRCEKGKKEWFYFFP